MNATFTDDWTTIHHGDCLTVMADMEPDSIDAIVTDPPYGLSFMGREWDHGVPGEAFWREALRVAKPGAHLVAFGGTRTYHRLAVAIEDAGWEVRDCLGWLYGSGFPKSLDVSKAIDKGSGENRDRQLEFTAWMRSTGITAAQINNATCSFMGSHYLTDKAQAAIATADMFDLLRSSLPEIPERIERLVAERTGIEWTAYKQREVFSERPAFGIGGNGAYSGHSEGATMKVTAPATDLARQWDGWGTALKPAWEPIILARKPLTGTVAGNVQRWGTGAINIDGCRVQYASEGDAAAAAAAAAAEQRSRQTDRNFDGWGMSAQTLDRAEYLAGSAGIGRWPANIVHDGSDEVLAVFPQTASGKMQPTPVQSGERTVFGADAASGYTTIETYGDSGSAARFFQTCKFTEEDIAWHDQSLTPSSASNAASSSSPSSLPADSAPSDAATSDHREATPCQESAATPGCTANCASCTQTPSHAPSAESQESTATIPTTTSRSRSCGSAPLVTGAPINSASAVRVADGSDPALEMRFLYSAKASKSERDEGLFDFEEQRRTDGREKDIENPRLRTSPRKNFHPTVKPLDLMRWLVRLVTPPDGVVLDPFMGSGTTLKAARAEGHRSIGIDLEREHCEIAWGRLSQGVLL